MSGRNFIGTYNNYSEDEVPVVAGYLDSLTGCKYVFQREVGANGTPHLQVGVFFGTPRAVTWQRGLPSASRWHWEMAKKKLATIKYCSKLSTRLEGSLPLTNIADLPEEQQPVRDPLRGKTLYDWQLAVKTKCLEQADERTINWIWEPEGNTGKTALIKHLLISMGKRATLVGGGAKDAVYAVFSLAWKPEVVFFNLTRSQESFVSYQAIESLKDGVCASSKYESGMLLMNCPHIFIFANFEPEREKLSADRWVVTRVGEATAYAPGFVPPTVGGCTGLSTCACHVCFARE